MIDFIIDGYLSNILIATATYNLGRVFGRKPELWEEEQFKLSLGFDYDSCRWELGKRWGYCHSNGTVTECIGERYFDL